MEVDVEVEPVAEEPEVGRVAATSRARASRADAAAASSRACSAAARSRWPRRSPSSPRRPSPRPRRFSSPTSRARSSRPRRAIDPDRIEAVLVGVLDDLGSAHHRPFSRG